MDYLELKLMFNNLLDVIDTKVLSPKNLDKRFTQCGDHGCRVTVPVAFWNLGVRRYASGPPGTPNDLSK